jgi:hypothetical protein
MDREERGWDLGFKIEIEPRLDRTKAQPSNTVPPGSMGDP